MHALTVARDMPLPIDALYSAWTTGWTTWFAEADSIRMTPSAGEPFYFEVVQRFDDGRPDVRHAHHGRFLALEPASKVSLTWVTGPSGTSGVETIVTAQFEPTTRGTLVKVTHEGFATADARDAHAAAWPMVLAQQEARLSALNTPAVVDVRPGAAVERARASHASRPESGTLPRNRSMPDAALIPMRSYPDLDAAVAWLRDVLGCEERLRVPGHRVQLTVGNGAVMVAAWDPASSPATGGRPPAILLVRVADVDASYRRALALGATGLTPPTDEPYGERQASVRDPAGHAWSLTQTVADVDPASWGGELVE